MKTHNIQTQLIKSAKKGKQKAIRQLYEQYVQAMYNTCIRMLGNKHDAEDVVQEAFISAFNNLQRFDENNHFGAWLKRIVINKAIDFLRTTKRNFIDVDEVAIAANDDNEPDNINIDFTELNKHIQTLPEKARVVFNLYLLEGYRHKEIAEMLNISESTSKSQYTRAKQLLKQKIQK